MSSPPAQSPARSCARPASVSPVPAQAQALAWSPLVRRLPALCPKPSEAWVRFTDCALCLLAVLPALAIVAVCALAVRLETPGPVLFRQWRVGRNGRRFRLCKLRTMVADAEIRKEALRAYSELPWPDFKLAGDPRVTRIGAWLRRTSLDELPQLWNVLRGEMALVGPRPTSFSAETYELWQTERLEVRPGLTGLWQVRSRGRGTFPERVRLDVAYLRKRSWRFNAAILLTTVRTVWSGDGAK